MPKDHFGPTPWYEKVGVAIIGTLLVSVVLALLLGWYAFGNWVENKFICPDDPSECNQWGDHPGGW